MAILGCHRFRLALGCWAATLGSLTAVSTHAEDSPLPVAPEPVLAAFEAHVAALPNAEAGAKSQALQAVKAGRADAGLRDDCIQDALWLLHPGYRQAMADLADEKLELAALNFETLRAQSDPYLAAHATLQLARARMQAERQEEALPLLRELTHGRHRAHTLAQGEAMFMAGVCQARALRRDEASATLETFLALHGDAAPERLVVGARQVLHELRFISEGSLADVQDRMGFSHRRLAQERVGKPTQEEQGKIVALLNKLIEEAEQREKNKGGGGDGGGPGGGGPPNGNGQPSAPAQDSFAPEGEARIGDLHRFNKGKASDSWGNLPPKEREKILSALKAKYPDRYKELIEQYYKSFQSDPK